MFSLATSKFLLLSSKENWKSQHQGRIQGYTFHFFGESSAGKTMFFSIDVPRVG